MLQHDAKVVAELLLLFGCEFQAREQGDVFDFFEAEFGPGSSGAILSPSD
jgi:hypothetical protein